MLDGQCHSLQLRIALYPYVLARVRLQALLMHIQRTSTCTCVCVCVEEGGGRGASLSSHITYLTGLPSFYLFPPPSVSLSSFPGLLPGCWRLWITNSHKHMYLPPHMHVPLMVAKPCIYHLVIAGLLLPRNCLFLVMSASNVAAPLSVDDVVERLRAPHSTDSDAGRRDAASYTFPPLLPLPPTVADQHRVQLVLRGRRFETPMEVASNYALTFHLFFHCSFEGGKTVGEMNEELSSERLLLHYVNVVEPALLRFLRHEQQQHLREESAAGGDLFVPPALPRPTSITFDATSRVWRFEYPARLTSDEEAEERTRRRHAMAAAPTGGAQPTPAHITTDELNSSPFLLLQNDYMGVLLVYLRRCAKVRRDNATAAPAVTPYPALPIRWKEMSYDDQVSFLQLLRAFGVVPLTRTYRRPTADLSTSLFVGADAARVAAEAKEEGEVCSLRVKAHEFWQLQQQQQRPYSDTHHMKRVGRSGVDDDDNDGVVLSATGCARCGLAGHATTACPY